MSGPTSASTKCRIIPCMTSIIPVSAAPIVRLLSHRVMIRERAAGKTLPKPSADYIRPDGHARHSGKNFEGPKASKDLTWEESKQAIKALIEGEATPAQVGAFLMAMRFKMESVTELAAFTAAARQYVPPLQVSRELALVDVPSLCRQTRLVPCAYCGLHRRRCPPALQC